MLKRVRISNFRSIRDSGNILFSKLNVFVGPNNSGKSSLLYALLMLKQTLEDKDPTATLVTAGPHVDLGSYLDIVRGHKPSEMIRLEFDLDDNIVQSSRLTSLTGFFTKANGAFPTSAGDAGPYTKFKVALGFDDSANAIGVCSFEMGEKRSKTFCRGERRDGKWILDGLPDKLQEHVQLGFVHFVPRFSPRLTRTPAGKTLIEKALNLFASDFTREAVFSYAFGALRYVGPVRERIPRYGILGTMPSSQLGPSGENLMRVLSAVGRKGMSMRLVIEELNDWLDRRFGLLKNVRIIDVDKAKTVKALLADDPPAHRDVNLAAMGSGISQIVPVVVQTILTPPNGCLMVEQPEIHLHPSAQANLADLFIESAKKKRQLIIETHSEHLLLRIRRRVAEGRIDPELVRIFFVEKRRGETKVRRLKLDENGHFLRWPKGFFEEGYREALAIALARPE
jgi:predicted ATPase